MTSDVGELLLSVVNDHYYYCALPTRYSAALDNSCFTKYQPSILQIQTQQVPPNASEQNHNDSTEILTVETKFDNNNNALQKTDDSDAKKKIVKIYSEKIYDRNNIFLGVQKHVHYSPKSVLKLLTKEPRTLKKACQRRDNTFKSLEEFPVTSANSQDIPRAPSETSKGTDSRLPTAQSTEDQHISTRSTKPMDPQLKYEEMDPVQSALDRVARRAYACVRGCSRDIAEAKIIETELRMKAIRGTKGGSRVRKVTCTLP